MRETQCATIQRILSDGRWHPVDEFMQAQIPDYRRRLCDLRAAGRHLDRRPRAHVRADGSRSHPRNDWMDVEANAAVGQEVYRQVVQARASHQGGAHAHTSVQITLPGTSINVALGRVLYLSAGQMTAEIMAGWADSAL